MATLNRTLAHSVGRFDHVGKVVTPPALLEQRRDERRRRTEAVGATIIGEASQPMNEALAGGR
jgi:hypothetical protein